MRITRSLACTMLTLAAACGGGAYGSSPTAPTNGTNTGSTGSAPAPTLTNAVSVMDNQFTPAAIQVAPGTNVTWTWGGANRHNVTFDDGTASATQSSGTYQRTFSTAGTYAYHCTIHGAIMSGTVVVK